MSFADFTMAAFVVVFIINITLSGLLAYLLIKLSKFQGGNGSFVVVRDALSGEAARVMSGRQIVRSVSSPVTSFMADQGWHFSANTGQVDLPDNFNGGLMYFRNDNQTMKFFVNKIIFGWTPNSVNPNENINMIVDYDASEPTGLFATAYGGNSNRGHNRTNQEAGRFALIWNGSGATGFEGAKDGESGIPYTIRPGQFIHDIEGNLIVNTGRSLTFNVRSNEVGRFNLSLTGWFAAEL